MRELTDRIAELEATLRIAREALESSYNVTTYPGDGSGRQAGAIRAIDRALLTEARDGEWPARGD